MTSILGGCGDGGGSAHNPPVALNASGAMKFVVLESQSTSVALVTGAGLSTTIVFPAVTAETAVDVSVSQTAPSALQTVRRAQDNFSLDIYEYITLSPHTTVSLPTLPALSFTFPSTVVLDGKSVFFGITDPVAQAGVLAAFETEGPAKVTADKATIGAVARPLVLQAGHHYTFMVYGLSLPSSVTKPTIVVGDTSDRNYGTGPPADILTFHAGGSPDLPQITGGLIEPSALAVAPNGTIYAVDKGDDTVKSYGPSGARAALTIALPPSPGPDDEYIYDAMSVGPDGTIEVSVIDCGGVCVGRILRFAPNGTALARIDVPGLPVAQAVDAAGNIFILADLSGENNGTGTSVIRFTPNGSAHTTLVSGLRFATALAVNAAGDMYVVENQIIRSFAADGSPRTLLIAPNFVPGGIAVDASGKTYVLDPAGEQLVSYHPDGSPAAPTINTGYSPFAVVVH